MAFAFFAGKVVLKLASRARVGGLSGTTALTVVGVEAINHFGTGKLKGTMVEGSMGQSDDILGAWPAPTLAQDTSSPGKTVTVLPLPFTGTNLVQTRLELSQFDQLAPEDRAKIVRALKRSPDIRSSLASTPEGAAFLAAQKIKLTSAEQLAASAKSIGRGVAPKKLGGAAGMIKPLADAAGAITSGITALDRLFAANPPDP